MSHLAAENATEAVYVYHAVDGSPVTPKIFRCPRCGYFELNVAFEGQYQGPKDRSPNKVSEDWLCASSPIETERAAAFLEKGKVSPSST